MKSKKLLSFLALVLSLLVLTACDFDDDDHVQSSASSSSTSSSSVSTAVTEDVAKETAVSDAGFSVSEVTFTSVSQDTENGVAVYEVEFVKDTTEYSYTINQTSGEIIEKESEPVND